jgi:hypothetical protein
MLHIRKPDGFMRDKENKRVNPKIFIHCMKTLAL